MTFLLVTQKLSRKARPEARDIYIFRFRHEICHLRLQRPAMIHNSSPVPSNVEYLVHLGNKRFEDLLRTTLQYHLFMMRTITYGYYLFAYILLMDARKIIVPAASYIWKRFRRSVSPPSSHCQLWYFLINNMRIITNSISKYYISLLD